MISFPGKVFQTTNPPNKQSTRLTLVIGNAYDGTQSLEFVVSVIHIVEMPQASCFQ